MQNFNRGSILCILKFIRVSSRGLGNTLPVASLYNTGNSPTAEQPNSNLVPVPQVMLKIHLKG